MPHSQDKISNRLLKALSAPDFSKLAPHLIPMDLKLREIVAAADGDIETVIFPQSGILSLVAQSPEERVEVGLLGREGAAGVAAVFGAKKYTFAMMCQAQGHALQIETKIIQQAVRESPTLASVMGLYLNNLAIQIGQTAYANAALNLEAKLARWILMSHDRMNSAHLPLTHEFLSVMLGVRRAGVTTAIHVLEGVGLIKAERGAITILDRSRLTELARDAYGAAEADYDRTLGALQE